MVEYTLGPVHGLDGAVGDLASDYIGYAGTDGASQILQLTGTISQPSDPILTYYLWGGLGGNGGNGPAAINNAGGIGGSGGDTFVDLTNASFDPELVFTVRAIGGSAGHGGWASTGGGIIVTTNGVSVFQPQNGPGGDAGQAGLAAITVQSSSLPLATTLQAYGGNGAAGGAGGPVYLAGYSPNGLSSSGADGTITVADSSFSGSGSLSLVAVGGAGERNRSYTTTTDASDGGNGSVVFSGNTIDASQSFLIQLWGAGREAGGTFFNDGSPMGADGDGTVTFTNNQVTMTGADDRLAFHFTALGGGRFGNASISITGNTLDGGAGYDVLEIVSYTMTNVYAGGIYNGITFDMMLNDVRSFEEIRASWQFNSTILGDNNDNRLVAERSLSSVSSYASQTLNGRGGNDTLVSGQGNDNLDGGADQDTVVFTGNRADYTIMVLANGSLSVADTRIGSIFVDGTDTVSNVELFQFADGTVTRAALTAGVTITGTSRADTITPLQTVAGQPAVTALDDTIYGLGGSDRIDGGVGADIMYGGSGNDTYFVDNVGDRVIEDTVAGVDDRGTDLVNSSVSFTLGAFVENLTLTGSDNIDGIGNGLANRIVGNAGDNRLIGGAGADMLTGGLGADTFILDVAGTSRQRDTFVDFVPGTDRIEISTSAFPALAAYGLGALDPSELAYGRRAATPDQHLIYNSTTGELMYDPDGAGGAVAVTLAVLTGLPSVGAADIFLTA